MAAGRDGLRLEELDERAIVLPARKLEDAIPIEPRGGREAGGPPDVALVLCSL